MGKSGKWEKRGFQVGYWLIVSRSRDRQGAGLSPLPDGRGSVLAAHSLQNGAKPLTSSQGLGSPGIGPLEMGGIMKVYEIRDRFGLDALTLAERPQPQPGPHEVLVRIRAASLNYRDLLVVKGQYNPKMPLPRIPLSDAAGEVAAVGPGVRRVQVGQRVAAIFMQTMALRRAGRGQGEVGAGRRHRRSAGRVCRAARGWRGGGAGAPELRGGGDASLRRRHRLAWPDYRGARQARRQRARAGHRRRVAVRLAVRPPGRRPRPHHV